MFTEENFLSLAKAKYSDINKLSEAPSLLDYERGLSELMNELTRQVMESQLSGKTNDSRKKKLL